MKKQYAIMLFQETHLDPLLAVGKPSPVFLPTPFCVNVEHSEHHFMMADVGEQFACDSLREAQGMVDNIVNPFMSLTTLKPGLARVFTYPYVGLLASIFRHTVEGQKKLTRDYDPIPHPSTPIVKSEITVLGGRAALAIMEYEGIYDIGAPTTRVVEVYPFKANLERANVAQTEGEIFNAIRY